MRPSDLRRAAVRLENVCMPSPITQAALWMVRRNPSQAALIGDLASRKRAPIALTVLSAMENQSETVFQAVTESIRCDSYLSWALVESLNELPWYNGLRAFLSLPGDPCSSPVAYPFYILARNKVFVTDDAAVRRYDYHVKALWHTLAVARDGDWRRLETPAMTIVELLRGLLNKPEPDPFVVHFASLLFGRVAPLSVNREVLQARCSKDCCASVQAVAALTLRHMNASGASGIRYLTPPGKKASRCIMRALAALLAF